MTVQIQDTFNESMANGVTTLFAFGFKLLNAGDLVVELDGVPVTTGFTIAGLGEASGGSITFDVAPANNVKVMRKRIIPPQRLIDYQNNGDLLAQTVNMDFDRLWMAIQGAGYDFSRAIKLPFGTTTDQTITESPALRTGKLVSFDEAGNVQLKAATDIDLTLVTVFAAQLLQAADAAAARTLLDFDTRASELIAAALSSYQQNIHYPVGSEYKNYVDDTSPATILGFGTWARVSGVVTVGRVATTDADFGTLGATGGERTHTLTVGEVPALHINSNVVVGSQASGPSSGTGGGGNFQFANLAGAAGLTSTTDGGGNAHNNLQPYVVVSLWKRTA